MSSRSTDAKQQAIDIMLAQLRAKCISESYSTSGLVLPETRLSLTPPPRARARCCTYVWPSLTLPARLSHC
jgi:hypothetical protein